MDFVPVLRFAVVSDVHYKDEPSVERDRFAEAMELAYAHADGCAAYPSLDALVVVGDFTDKGSEEQMLAFKASLDSSLRGGTRAVLTVASHEYGSGGPAAANEKLLRIFGAQPDCHEEVNGFHFIAVSPTDGCNYREEKREYIAAELKKAASGDRKKPIFFFQHPHIQDTVYGSMLWGNDDFIPTLMNYPQIINFSGHSHAPINDPRSVHQRHFTCFGTGTLSYFELDEFDKIYGTVPPRAHEAAQMLIVEADALNRVRVYPVDVLTGNYFPFVWRVDEPWNVESFIYTDERYKTADAPRFAEGDTLAVEVEGCRCTIDIPQAKVDREYVNSYDVTLRRAEDGTTFGKVSVWSMYYFYDMPPRVRAEFDGLAAGEEYTVEVYANSFWKTRSERPLTAAFRA